MIRRCVHRFQTYLENAFGGKAQDWNVRIDDSLLARAFVTIRLTPSSPHPDLAKLENGLREMCRSWSDRLRDCLVAEYGEAAALALLRRYGEAFPAAYRDVGRRRCAPCAIFTIWSAAKRHCAGRSDRRSFAARTKPALCISSCSSRNNRSRFPKCCR